MSRIATAAGLLGAAFLISSGAARAQDQERDFCPDRPGIGTPACTLSPGRTMVEVGLGDWSLAKDAGERQDLFLTGDALLRHGIAGHAEVQLAWTALGIARTRDRASGAVDHRTGTGDVTLAVRRNLANPDRSKLAVAVMPFVSLPVGREPIGESTWSAGMMVPLSYELSDKLSLVTTSEFDAAANDEGHGRHFAFSEVVGAEVSLSDAVSVTAEYQLTADRSPHAHHLEHLSGLSLAWQSSRNLRLDVGANIGLDHDTQDAEMYFGIARRF